MVPKNTYSSYQSKDNNNNTAANWKDETPRTNHSYGKPKTHAPKMILILGAVAVLGMILFVWTTTTSPNNTTNVSMKDADASLVVLGSSHSKKGTKKSHHKHAKSGHDDDDEEEVEDEPMPMPYGVNLGSWLSLEDYFYVGNTGAVEVATPDENTAAVCLPPLHLGQEGAPAWQSETDLLKRYDVKWYWCGIVV